MLILSKYSFGCGEAALSLCVKPFYLAKTPRRKVFGCSFAALRFILLFCCMTALLQADEIDDDESEAESETEAAEDFDRQQPAQTSPNILKSKKEEPKGNHLNNGKHSTAGKAELGQHPIQANPANAHNQKALDKPKSSAVPTPEANPIPKAFPTERYKPLWEQSSFHLPSPDIAEISTPGFADQWVMNGYDGDNILLYDKGKQKGMVINRHKPDNNGIILVSLDTDQKNNAQNATAKIKEVATGKIATIRFDKTLVTSSSSVLPANLPTNLTGLTPTLPNQPINAIAPTGGRLSSIEKPSFRGSGDSEAQPRRRIIAPRSNSPSVFPPFSPSETPSQLMPTDRRSFMEQLIPNPVAVDQIQPILPPNPETENLPSDSE